MSVVMALYLVVLFVVLTPGVFVSLPPKGSKLVVALTHAVVFAVVYQLTHRMVARALEGFAVNVVTNPSSMGAKPSGAAAPEAAPKSGPAVAGGKPTATGSGIQMVTF